MKQHFQEVDVDIMGLSEVDGITGECSDAYIQLVQMMQELGYDHIHKDKPDGMSGSAIFWKKDRFNLIRQWNIPYSPGESQALTLGLFSLVMDPTFYIVLGETHLKAKP